MKMQEIFSVRKGGHKVFKYIKIFDDLKLTNLTCQHMRIAK